ncbi:MAG TPA: XRE family transcriptional regulator [Candidatus Saccharimonadia bacterium]|nr:XRE family transcriptional regulator [Candidatus Saccharimonadia bacterium]
MTSGHRARVAADRLDTPPPSVGAGRPRPAVGRQVKHWRTERGLTLAQVAERSGLNVGYLSQIENDKASPSLESLGAIGAALEVPVAWFLQDASLPPRVVRAADRRNWEAPGGGRVEEVDGGVSRELCIVQVSSLPGGRTGLHAHPGDEHHIMLRGRLRLTQGDHVVELGPGDYLLWDATIPHDAESIGDEPPVVLIVSTRQRGTETAPPE